MQVQFLNQNYELFKADFPPFAYQIDGKAQLATSVTRYDPNKQERRFITESEYDTIKGAYAKLSDQHKALLKDVAVKDIQYKQEKTLLAGLSPAERQSYDNALQTVGLRHNQTTFAVVQDIENGGPQRASPVFDVNGHAVAQDCMTPAVVSMFNGATLRAAQRFFDTYKGSGLEVAKRELDREGSTPAATAAAQYPPQQPRVVMTPNAKRA